MVESANGFRLDRIAFLSPGAADLSLSGGEPAGRWAKAPEDDDSAAAPRSDPAPPAAAGQAIPPAAQIGRSGGEAPQTRDESRDSVPGETRSDGEPMASDAAPASEPTNPAFAAYNEAGAAAPASLTPAAATVPTSAEQNRKGEPVDGGDQQATFDLGGSDPSLVGPAPALADVTGPVASLDVVRALDQVVDGPGIIELEVAPVADLVDLDGSDALAQSEVRLSFDSPTDLGPVDALSVGVSPGVSAPLGAAQAAAADVDEEIGQILDAMAIASPVSEVIVAGGEMDGGDSPLADFGSVEPEAVSVATEAGSLDHVDLDGLSL